MRGRLGKAWDRLRGGDRTRRTGRLSASQRKVRDKKIRKLHSEGHSLSAIAREVGVHEKTVERVLKAGEKAKAKTVAEVLQRQGVAGVEELFSDPEMRARYAQKLVDQELGVSDTADSGEGSPLELLMVELLEEMQKQDPVDKLLEQGKQWEALKHHWGSEGGSLGEELVRGLTQVLQGPVGGVLTQQWLAQMGQAGRPPQLSPPAQPGVQVEVAAPGSTGTPQGASGVEGSAVSPSGGETAQGPGPAGVGPMSGPQGLPELPAWVPLDRLLAVIADSPEEAAAQVLRFCMEKYQAGDGQPLQAVSSLAEMPVSTVTLFLAAQAQHPIYAPYVRAVFERPAWLDRFLDGLLDGLEAIQVSKDSFAESGESQDATPPAQHENGPGI